MCWNQEVSLNTFLFSTFVLLLIIYNNTFTKYKIKEINNIWWYLFLLSVFSMQLLEFFIWRNIYNSYNIFFSKMIFIVLFLQPIFSLMILSKKNIRNILLSIYVIIGLPYILYKIFIQKSKTFVTPLGHLNWNLKSNNIVFIGWLFCLLFSFFYEQNLWYFFFGLITLLAIMYKYYFDKSINSIWCWIINSMSIYFAFYLLFYLPFYKK
jgi:hypothetical protein